MKDYERTTQSISLSEVDKEDNIISNWLEKNGDPQITKQVEREAEELCEQQRMYSEYEVKK